MTPLENIVVACISVLGTVIVSLISYAANRKGAREASESNAKLIAYRLEELEKKVNKHNNVIERMYKIEGEMAEVQHNIRNLEGAHT